MAESYQRWRLPQLWEMLTADDPEHAHLHLTTLRRQQTALETQRDGLRLLRDHLAEAWPPEKSEAASAFIQRLNDMLDALTATARGAADVRVAVALTVNAIEGARHQLAPLVERYAKAEAVVDPRVSQQAKKVLDQEARQILISADGTVRDANTALQVALPTYARIGMLTDVPPVTSGGDVTGAGSGGGGAKRASERLGELRPPRFDPPAPVTADIAGDDVVLAEEPRGVQANGLWPGDTGTGSSGGVSPRGSLEMNPTVGRVLGVGPVSGMPVSVNDGIARGVGGGVTRGVPGGVIGSAPPMAARGGVMRTAAASARSVSAGVRPSGAGGHQDRSFEEYVARRRVQDTGHDEQWAVNQGVTPLLEALPPVRTHDPGPGVIGLDR
ncbi:hypothetical protein AB0J72_33700 [Dactylosporangium sp. NPDC049742]|uniref:hypothetical protein n=1 Tax=Dactylosporangium sp. NPDC049742 TaxID=3154737 RepID=UPI00342B53D2